MQIEIGVRRLDQGRDSWAMVPAQETAANIYVILDNNIEEDEGCELEFKPGNMVTAMEHEDAEGRAFLGAMRLYGPAPF